MKKLILLSVLILLDILFVKLFLIETLQKARLEIVIIYGYCFMANFIIAAILSRTNLGLYSGMFIINAFLVLGVLYLYS